MKWAVRPEEKKMETTPLKPSFAGPYEELLAELDRLIDWLFEEHGVSFVKAGDDKVYAFGGNGYILVLDQKRWQGTVELFTPEAAITISPDPGGSLSINAPDRSQEDIKRLIQEGIEGLRSYYENRYWSTPR